MGHTDLKKFHQVKTQLGSYEHGNLTALLFNSLNQHTHTHNPEIHTHTTHIYITHMYMSVYSWQCFQIKLPLLT